MVFPSPASSPRLGLRRRAPHWLPAVLLFLAAGLFYNAAFPVMEGSDEPFHYGYIEQLRRGEGFPDPTRAPGNLAQYESSQAPLYYMTVAGVLRALPVPDFDGERRMNDWFGGQAGVNDNRNLHLHNLDSPLEWFQGIALGVRVARLIATLYGALTVLAAYLIAREATDGVPWLPLVAAAMVAFNPQFIQAAAVTENDSSASAFIGLALWRLVRIIRRNPGAIWEYVLAGLFVGLATIGKGSALIAVPVAALGLALAWWEGRRETGAWTWVGRAAALFGAAALAGGWWYVRNWQLYADPLRGSAYNDYPWMYPELHTIGMLIPDIPRSMLSYWADLGYSGDIRPSSVFYAGAWIITGAALVGLVRFAFTRRGEIYLAPAKAAPDLTSPSADSLSSPSPLQGGGSGRGCMTSRPFRSPSIPGASYHGPTQTRRGLASRAALALLAGSGLLTIMMYVRLQQTFSFAWGRHLFPSVTAFGTLLAAGLYHAWPRRGKLLGQAATAFLAMYAFLIPPLILLPAYLPPRVAQFPPLTEHLDWTFGEIVRLEGYQVDSRSLAAGQPTVVTLCWETLARPEIDYAFALHIVGPEGQLVGVRDSYHGLGRYPSSAWRVGDRFCDRVRVQVADDLPSAQLYQMLIAVYEPDTLDKLPATLADGTPAPTFAGWLKAPPVVPIPPGAARLDADVVFGEAIALRAYQLRGGSQPALALYWEVLGPVEGDYAVFVHVIDVNRALVAQADGLPRQGQYPTWLWEPGEVIEDVHPLALPPDVDWPLRVLVGLYSPVTAERLPALRDGEPVLDNAVEILTLDAAP